ncbi:MAG: hypothetical protein MZV63_44520 [Marinilabiliales bacterium]|nr:hypothetical protein [Marinilabiliales bacterium]
MLYDAKLSQEFAAKLLNEGIYVIGFYYPVVPKEKAESGFRSQLVTKENILDKAVAGFIKIGKELGVIK